jgi:hypothetical protein
LLALTVAAAKILAIKVGTFIDLFVCLVGPPALSAQLLHVVPAWPVDMDILPNYMP